MLVKSAKSGNVMLSVWELQAIGSAFQNYSCKICLSRVRSLIQSFFVFLFLAWTHVNWTELARDSKAVVLWPLSSVVKPAQEIPAPNRISLPVSLFPGRVFCRSEMWSLSDPIFRKKHYRTLPISSVFPRAVCYWWAVWICDQPCWNGWRNEVPCAGSRGWKYSCSSRPRCRVKSRPRWADLCRVVLVARNQYIQALRAVVWNNVREFSEQSVLLS